MSLAKAIEHHVDAFVEHSMSPSPNTLAALKTSRQNLAEATVAAIVAKYIRQPSAVAGSRTKTALVGRLMERPQGVNRAMQAA
ncbi:MAG TPA: hypothetical protein VKS24_22085 [Bradyrhizobium sp.]|nr:hypothetical protein [Bradyrhizobium sp.]